MIKQNVVYQAYDGEPCTLYPGVSLGDRLMNMYDRGVEDFDVQEKTYDDDDATDVDPLADIRSDRFALMELGEVIAQTPRVTIPVEPTSTEPAPVEPTSTEPAPTATE